MPSTPCPPGGGDDGGGDSGKLSDGTQKANYQTPTKSCSLYANGAGMGMYCVTPGQGTSKTLRERYGSQKLPAMPLLRDSCLDPDTAQRQSRQGPVHADDVSRQHRLRHLQRWP
ncbi:hypothetical protein [Aeromicrobium sp. UC242_57]|uniref:hypothetical protein n=1 Tax=Aeromicrobium sp. UC242_57 TaxID=3374624 RepID=UPI00379AE354